MADHLSDWHLLCCVEPYVLRTGTFSGGWATDLYAASADLLGGNDPGDDEFL